MTIKVLHVTEAFGGGIVSSLFSFAKNTPDVEHHLLYCERPLEPLAKNLSAVFSSISCMRNSLFGSICDIRKKYFELNPDVVHLHSSFGGVYGRLSGITPRKIVYSPHGFAFERTASNRAARYLYYLAEKLLSRRCNSFAGVSHEELLLAKKLNRRCRRVFVPNSSDFPTRSMQKPNGSETINAICVGRLCSQKDPEFLANSLELIPEKIRQKLSVTWVGSGDDAMATKLRSVGVKVTGWVPHEQAIEMLSKAELYLHVAAWEGFPMTLIEAATMGMPVLVRSIAAFRGFSLDENSLAETPVTFAKLLVKWIEDVDSRKGSYNSAELIRKVCSPTNQSVCLQELYHPYMRSPPLYQ